MSPPAQSAIRRFPGDRRAASAVEFAMVAPILLGLIFTTFEMGWYMVQAVLLDHGLDRVTRQIRIGQAGDIDHATFKQRVCEASIILFACEDDLVVEMIPVVTLADFPEDGAVCADRESEIAPVIRFDPGARSEILYIRACLLIDPLVPGLGLGRHLDKDESGATRLISHSAFVNEPE